MSQRQGVLLLIAFGLALGNAEASDPAQAPSDELVKLTRARLEAARRTYERFGSDKDWRDAEIPYRWSCRWLEAQCQVSDKPEDRVAAFRDHLDRMQELERVTRKRYQGRLENVDDVHAADYYVAEAAEWLARAKARVPRSETKR